MTCEHCESAVEALEKVLQWAEAYPVSVFPEVPKEDWARIHEVLKAAGLSLDRVSASNMRHVITRVAEIARKGLPDQPTASQL